MKEPVAGDTRASRSFWIERMNYHMIVQEIEQNVRQLNDTVVAPEVGGEQSRQWWARGLARNAKGLDVFGECRSLALAVDLAGPEAREQIAQLGMHRAA